MPQSDRWPPVYSAEELLKQITDLISDKSIFSKFYEPNLLDPEKCQGDIIELDSEALFLDEDNTPVTSPERYTHWLLIGNTCDIYRDMNLAKWSQIVPIYNLGKSEEISVEELGKLQAYSQSRVFYLPPWESGLEGAHFLADFLRPVTIHKAGLMKSKTVGRVNKFTWILLHSCLIRFLARDDGRYD
jgi:hypothetical protein